MKKDNKKEAPKIGTGLSKKIQTENRQELQQLIIRLTEQKTEERFSDPQLDREREKIQLLGGAEITLKQIRTIIAGKLQQYQPIFHQEWYDWIFKLNRNSNDVDPSHQWSAEKAREFVKPSEVADFTNEIIYGRFPLGILPVLQQLNPYVGFNVRAHKNYQYLTEDGYEKVKLFIKQSLAMMQTCTNWYEFRVKYNRQYGVPYQIDVFEESKYSL